MKSLSKITFRYLLTAALIIVLALVLNIMIYIITSFRIIQSGNHFSLTSKEIAAQFQAVDNGPVLSQTGYEYLSRDYVWGMLLDDSGQVIWSWQLPENLNHSYTSSEIAAFSKWYLDDYPVTTRITDYGLLVVANPRDSVWKYNLSDSMSRLNQILYMVPVTLLLNLLFVFLMVLFFSARFYGSLRSIASGIQQLSEQKTIRLPERGMTELLAKQLNQTSAILDEQKRRLKKRDDARTTWIAGISHDIRTPLSLIMGYASALKEDTTLSLQHRQQAATIEAQSLQIKYLIEDLNLTSKLEYGMQPLRTTEFYPSALLRKIVTDFYNQGMNENFCIDLQIEPGIEQKTLTGDTSLLTRAFCNLLRNSILHNPAGCAVTVTAALLGKDICFRVSDTGCGIPRNVIALLEGYPLDEEKPPHIMGLRIVKQIVEAHGWEMMFADTRTIEFLVKNCKKNSN